jgi:hypothetical protein
MSIPSLPMELQDVPDDVRLSARTNKRLAPP